MDVSGLREWIAIIGGAIGVITAAVAFARWVVFPLRRTVELMEAQLARNGGGSLTDKADRMYDSMFPKDETSLPETIKAIRQGQLDRASEMDSRHEDTLRRMDVLEAHGQDTERRLERIELRQDYMGRVLPAVVTVFPDSMQADIRRILEQNPPPEGGTTDGS